MKLRFSIFFVLIYICLSYSQSLFPFFKNYSKIDYKGDNQIWNITQAQDNSLYFANNHFILRYDGTKWEKNSLPENLIIRSIFYEKNKIFTGSYNEFGFWQRNNGKLIYKSLTKNNNLFKSLNEEIWKIFSFKNKIYFQTFTSLFIYNGKSIKKILFPEMISYCFVIDNKIYVMGLKKGAYIYENNKFSLLPNSLELENKVIHDVKKINGKLWFFTYKNGVFINDGKITKPWENNLNQTLKENRINSVQTNNNQILIGTANNGLLIYNIKLNNHIRINHENGLKNNSILNIFKDKEENFWLGLDSGIVHLEIKAPLEIYNDFSGKLGSVYSVDYYKNNYILTSNLGTFLIENNQSKVIPETIGQSWNVSNINNDSWIIGHNEATFLLKNNQIKKFNSINGGWKFINFYKNYYLQTSYNGIYIYEYINNNLKFIKKIENLYNPIYDIFVESSNNIWAIDNYKGIFKIKLDENFNLLSIDNIGQQNNINKDFKAKILPFKSMILFLSQGSWLEYNQLTSKLEPNLLFNSNFKSVQNVVKISDESFFILKEDKLYYIKYIKNKFIWNLIPEKYYSDRIINDFLFVEKKQNNFLINLEQGFIKLNINNKNSINIPKIEAFFDNEYLEENFKLPYNHKSINLYVIFNKFGFINTDLYYKINKDSDFMTIKNNKIELNNLSFGKYNIEFYIFENGKMKLIKNYKFKISAPFYFSFWAIILYIMLISAIFYVYYNFKVYKKNQAIKLKDKELKYYQELELIKIQTENQIKLQEIQKEELNQKFKNKTSETTAKALEIIKQNQTINQIINLLETEDDIKQIKNKISKIIKINQNQSHEWKIFEQNLIDLNKDFIRKLTEKFPNLTPKDIKLCIFLRMNLTSKEIAPLLNISYRSVELNRYRLRKKINISVDENLTKLILNI